METLPRGPLTRYVKLSTAHAPGMLGTFPPPPQVSDTDMHHGTCVKHVTWCMPGSLTSGFFFQVGGGENIPGIPGACMRNPQFYDSGKRPIISPLCVRGIPVTGEFPSKKFSSSRLWYFVCCWLAVFVEQTIVRSFVSDSVLRPFWDSVHRGPCSPYKPCNHNLHIGIIIFPHIDNTQYRGHN